MLWVQIKFFVSRILIVVMCYNIIGSALLFSIADLFHSSMMEELVNTQELSILKIPNKIIQLHPEIFMRLNAAEIFYEGNYYDVKKETCNNAFTFFYTLKDGSEKRWHQQLATSQADSNENHSDGKTKANVKLFSPEWFPASRVLLFRQNLSKHYSFYSCQSTCSLFEEIILPPPQA